MDEESYIISFFPGTSGKLIAQVLWRMINDIDEEILFTPQNSAHISYPWETSWSHPLTKDPNVAGPNMFDELSFQAKGILATQMFPNFDVLADKLPNTKVIVIQVEEQDLKEIAFNHITKNSMVSANYKKKAEERGHVLDEAFWDNVLKERQIDLIRWYKLNQDDNDLYIDVEHAQPRKHLGTSFGNFTGVEIKGNGFINLIVHGHQLIVIGDEDFVSANVIALTTALGAVINFKGSAWLG